MALEALKCPRCDGDVDLDDNQEYGFCKYCGTKVQNTNFKIVKVNIDKSTNIKKLISIAVNGGDYETAIHNYGKLIYEIPDDWESRFYSIYYSQLFNFKNDCLNIPKVKYSLKTEDSSINVTIESVFNLLEKSKLDEKTKKETYDTIGKLTKKLFTEVIEKNAMYKHELNSYSNYTKNMEMLKSVCNTYANEFKERGELKWYEEFTNVIKETFETYDKIAKKNLDSASKTTKK